MSVIRAWSRTISIVSTLVLAFGVITANAFADGSWDGRAELIRLFLDEDHPDYLKDFTFETEISGNKVSYTISGDDLRAAFYEQNRQVYRYSAPGAAQNPAQDTKVVNFHAALLAGTSTDEGQLILHGMGAGGQDVVVQSHQTFSIHIGVSDTTGSVQSGGQIRINLANPNSVPYSELRAFLEQNAQNGIYRDPNSNNTYFLYNGYIETANGFQYYPDGRIMQRNANGTFVLVAPNQAPSGVPVAHQGSNAGNGGDALSNLRVVLNGGSAAPLGGGIAVTSTPVQSQTPGMTIGGAQPAQGFGVQLNTQPVAAPGNTIGFRFVNNGAQANTPGANLQIAGAPGATQNGSNLIVSGTPGQTAQVGAGAQNSGAGVGFTLQPGSTRNSNGAFGGFQFPESGEFVFNNNSQAGSGTNQSSGVGISFPNAGLQNQNFTFNLSGSNPQQAMITGLQDISSYTFSTNPVENYQAQLFLMNIVSLNTSFSYLNDDQIHTRGKKLDLGNGENANIVRVKIPGNFNDVWLITRDLKTSSGTKQRLVSETEYKAIIEYAKSLGDDSNAKVFLQQAKSKGLVDSSGNARYPTSRYESATKIGIAVTGNFENIQQGFSVANGGNSAISFQFQESPSSAVAPATAGGFQFPTGGEFVFNQGQISQSPSQSGIGFQIGQLGQSQDNNAINFQIVNNGGGQGQILINGSPADDNLSNQLLQIYMNQSGATTFDENQFNSWLQGVASGQIESPEARTILLNLVNTQPGGHSQWQIVNQGGGTTPSGVAVVPAARKGYEFVWKPAYETETDANTDQASDASSQPADSDDHARSHSSDSASSKASEGKGFTVKQLGENEYRIISWNWETLPSGQVRKYGFGRFYVDSLPEGIDASGDFFFAWGKEPTTVTPGLVADAADSSEPQSAALDELKEVLGIIKVSEFSGTIINSETSAQLGDVRVVLEGTGIDFNELLPKLESNNVSYKILDGNGEDITQRVLRSGNRVQVRMPK